VKNSHPSPRDIYMNVCSLNIVCRNKTNKRKQLQIKIHKISNFKFQNDERNESTKRKTISTFFNMYRKMIYFGNWPFWVNGCGSSSVFCKLNTYYKKIQKKLGFCTDSRFRFFSFSRREFLVFFLEKRETRNARSAKFFEKEKTRKTCLLLLSKNEKTRNDVSRKTRNEKGDQRENEI